MDTHLVSGRIRAACKEKGWKFAELARRSGVPYNTLGTYLRKTRPPADPSFTHMVSIAEALGYPLDWFASEDPSPTP